MTDSLIIYLLGFFLITAFFFLSFSHWFKSHVKSNQFTRLIIIAIFVFYLSLSALFKFEVGDVKLFSGAGWYLRHGIDFYWIDSDHTQYPFFPLLIYYHALSNYLSENLLPFTFSFFLKILLFGALYYLSVLIKKSQGSLSQIRFLVSPITYCVVVIHGQVDVILLAFYFLSVSLFQKKSASSFFLGTLAYTASIAAKTWSVIFLPLIMFYQHNLKRNVVFLVVIFGLLISNIMVYVYSVSGSSFDTVWPAILKPGGPVGLWGFTYLLSFNPTFIQLIKQYHLYIFIILYIIILYLSFRRTKTLISASTLLIIGILCIIPNWGIQYLFWLLPFIYLTNLQIRKRSFTFIYQVLCLPYLFFTYAGIVSEQSLIHQNILNLFSFILWLYLIYAFIYFTANRNSKKNITSYN